MSFFPVYMDLANTEILLVGADHHARQKLEKLLPCGGHIRVLAEHGMEEYAVHPRVTLERRGFREEDLQPPPALVLVSGGERAEQRRISGLCRAARIPVNVVDVPELCSFYFPALITRGDFSLGICTGGKSPAAAALIRQQLEEEIPEKIDAILDWSSELRIREEFRALSPAERRLRLRTAVAAALELGRPLTEEELSLLERESSPAP